MRAIARGLVPIWLVFVSWCAWAGAPTVRLDGPWTVAERVEAPLTGISVTGGASADDRISLTLRVENGRLRGRDSLEVYALSLGQNQVMLNGSARAINDFILQGRLLFQAPLYRDSAKLTATVEDSNQQLSMVAGQIRITPRNDAPEVIVEEMSVILDLPTPLRSISVVDGDAGDAALTMTVKSERGVLLAEAGAGVTVAGSGGGQLKLQGSQTALNAFIAAERLRLLVGGAEVGAAATLTVTVNDNGHSGGTDSQEDSDYDEIRLVAGSSQGTQTAPPDSVLTLKQGDGRVVVSEGSTLIFPSRDSAVGKKLELGPLLKRATLELGGIRLTVATGADRAVVEPFMRGIGFGLRVNSGTVIVESQQADHTLIQAGDLQIWPGYYLDETQLAPQRTVVSVGAGPTRVSLPFGSWVRTRGVDMIEGAEFTLHDGGTAALSIGDFEIAIGNSWPDSAFGVVRVGNEPALVARFGEIRFSFIGENDRVRPLVVMGGLVLRSDNISLNEVILSQDAQGGAITMVDGSATLVPASGNGAASPLYISETALFKDGRPQGTILGSRHGDKMLLGDSPLPQGDGLEGMVAIPLIDGYVTGTDGNMTHLLSRLGRLVKPVLGEGDGAYPFQRPNGVLDLGAYPQGYGMALPIGQVRVTRSLPDGAGFDADDMLAVTVESHSLKLAPAVFDTVEFARRLKRDLPGMLPVLRADGSYLIRLLDQPRFVARPAWFHQRQSGLAEGFSVDPTGKLRYTGPDGSSQTLYPATHDPAALLRAAKSLDAAATLRFQGDATVRMTLFGRETLLQPTYELLPKAPAGREKELFWRENGWVHLRNDDGTVQAFVLR